MECNTDIINTLTTNEQEITNTRTTNSVIIKEDNCLNGCLDTNEECDPSATPTSATTKGCTPDPNYTTCSNTCTIERTIDDTSDDTDDNYENSDNTTSSTDDDSSDNKGTTASTTLSIETTMPACIATTASNNQSTILITIKNTGLANAEILQITDKLPQGTTYSSNTLRINGTLTSEDVITVTNSGVSQQVEIKPEQAFTITPNSTLTIQFSIETSGNTAVGQKTNEVIVTTSTVIANSSVLNSSTNTTIASSCTSPQTGIFDNMVYKVGIGIVLIVLGFVYFYADTAKNISDTVLFSNAYINGKLFYLRITKPRQYFEKKIVFKSAKKEERKSNKS
jgi:uncharacterized repeat protein (TIGR01451 family)